MFDNCIKNQSNILIQQGIYFNAPCHFTWILVLCIQLGLWCSYNRCWKKTILTFVHNYLLCRQQNKTISQRHQKHVDVSVDQWGRVVKNRSNASKLPQIFFFPWVNFHCNINTQIHAALICKTRDYFKGENVKLFQMDQSLIFDALKFKVCLIKMMNMDWCSWEPGITISIHQKSSSMCINISTEFPLLSQQNWRTFV